MASHIVGGEFELVHISGNNYRVNLILYFDKINGSPGARDNSVLATIYRKRDNVFMQNVSFGSPTETNVTYTQPACSRGEIWTSRLVYTTNIVLSDTRYNDPGGYYISWERCCRNYAITNVYSENPDVSGRAAGQTFYLEFPAVVKDGAPFINSSPRLFPPLSDYACPRRPYYVDFAGVDDDGDSLAYSLVTPLSTHSIIALPPPQSAPYPLVTWRNPFSLDKIINGDPDMKITTDGFLTATPSQQGLYVFAVKCDEFRNGVKIGEVRRDFQMLVVDVCPRAEAPQILGKKLGDPGFSFDEDMQVTFSGTVADSVRCVQVQVSDPDASKQDDNFSEKVKIKAIPLGFKKDVSGILPDISNATLVNGSTIAFDICFEKCPYVAGPFQVGIVAYDDACSLPLSDTLRITVDITPPPNALPYFTTPDVTEVINEGEIKTWLIRGLDDDGDKLVAGIIPQGFRLEDYGMTFTQVKSESGLYEAQLQWDTRCDVVDFSKKTSFNFMVLLDDIDECTLAQPDIMNFALTVKLPGNTVPIIDSDLTLDPFERSVTGLKRKINESLTFNVKGIDADNDLIVLDVRGVGFDITKYNVSFPTATGNNFVQSKFQWNIFCDEVDLRKKDEFTFQFIVVDHVNKCRYYNADTLDVTVKLYPPDNQEPLLQVVNMNQDIQMAADNSMTAVLGQQITLALLGTDKDKSPQADLLKLELIKAEGNVEPTGYVFANAEGRGTVQSTFSWNPDCSIFTGDSYRNQYTFTFRVVDDKCYSQMGDTVVVNININDLENEGKEFLPPNFVTPNGDNRNDFFAMVKEDENTGELVNILPTDNCTGVFEGIIIFNRWGKRVYESASRDFRWYAEGEVSGMYFYNLKYSDKDYKGIITLAFDSSESNR
ncbi:gliding motility-associated C-terminal domain-containing protein [Chryseolinea sp. H1M3-3]|uniref:T9SS type B sorting domain-containing protein n=1 Tax=Chryseolinea sp. H1M3-3 TaxID=3034144 RepID=UPI0023EBA681|nr:gliding motility-associated C-terminal domain-containing protein [Chryseolinea sp. H1M3-3]